MVLGLSINPARQVHFANPLLNNEHWVLGPHGDGSQGFFGNAHGVCGGSPSYSGRQKHVGNPDTIRQPLLAPHGLGWHWSPSGTVINDKLFNHTFYKSYFGVLTAILEGIASQSFRTITNWISAIQLTKRVNAARIRDTWIGWWLTCYGWISCITGRAFACRNMVVYITDRITTTLAWRLTFAINASGIRAALIVGSASQLSSTLNIWISCITTEATAIDFMINSIAFRIFATRIFLAWTNTAPIEAVTQFIWWTVFIVLTYWLVVQNWN